MRIDFRRIVELSTNETEREAQRILFYIENQVLMSKFDPNEKYKLQICYRRSYMNPIISKFLVRIIQRNKEEIVMEIKNLNCESWDIFDRIEEILNESGYKVMRHERRPIFGSRQWYISIEF